MYTVYRQGVDWLQPSHWLTVLIAESHIPADLFHGASGFDTANRVSFREVLVFEAHFGPDENPGCAKALEHCAELTENYVYAIL